MSYTQQHLNEAIEIIGKIDVASIEAMADLLAGVKSDGGRVFFLGVGGSAGNCSHAVNDFRKIVGIESYAPTPAYISVFAGRIADTGRDSLPLMSAAVELMRLKPKAELIWASPRELLNIFQANTIDCQVDHSN